MNTSKIIENWNAIVNLMEDDVRERVHQEMAECSEADFLRRYCEVDPTFSALLAGEFGILA